MTFKEASRVVFTSTDTAEIKEAIDSMHKFYVKETGLNGFEPGKEPLYSTPKGKYVSKYCAAHCLIDYNRTDSFLKGIFEAVANVFENKTEPIQILYAGCGPYASLVTPLTQVFSSNQIRFTLIDINKECIDSVHDIYRSLGTQNYVESTIVNDATSLGIEIEKSFDLIISETMSAALKTESQVPITQNLARYLKPHGVYIPQNISIMVGFSEEILTNDSDTKAIESENILSFNSASPPLEFEEVSITSLPHTPCFLYLLTEIKVYNDYYLKSQSCSLTRPFLLDRFYKKPAEIRLSYKVNEEPGFNHTINL